MKRIWKKTVSIMLTLLMVLSAMSTLALAAEINEAEPAAIDAEGELTAAVSDNYGHQNYSKYTSTVNSYLEKLNDGYMRVEYISGSIVVEYYDDEFKLTSNRTVEMELSIFGGFFAGTDAYYMVFGQSNSQMDDSLEVYRIVKYSTDWERLGQLSLTGSDTSTKTPLDAGACRMAEGEGYLYVRTSQTKYNGHQANVTIVIKESDMSLLSVICDGNNNVGYVSHSFNQFILVDDEKNIIALDHGDAYPRALILFKYTAQAGDSTFSSGRNSNIEVFPFQGSTGNNSTGASAGGLEYSSTAYLAAANSVTQDSSWSSHTARNVFVVSTSRSDFTSNGTEIKWITAYDTDGSVSTSTPQLVKTGSDSFLLMWTTIENSTVTGLQYVFLDGKGNTTGDIHTVDGALSDCQPIVADDGSVVWYVTGTGSKSTCPVFYRIDSTGEFSVAATVHNWGEPSWTWSSDHSSADAKFTCSACGATETVTGTVTSKTVDPTCTADGNTTYTATASFDGKTYTDTETETYPATGHSWGEPVWTWSSNYGSAQAKFTCSVCKETETVTGTITSTTVDPTCTASGKTTYTASATFDGKTYTDTEEETLPATGHSWGEPVWTWGSNYGSADAKFTCSACGATETVTGTITSATVDPTCTADGKTTYTATASFNGKTYTDTKEETLPATGHSWGEPAWSWSSDYRSADATFTCSVCKATETVTASVSVVTVDPVCTEGGQITSTANVVFEGKTYTDTKTETVPATGHTWSEVQWDWAADYESAVASRTCIVCGATETQNAVVTVSTTNPTCTEPGETVYTATAAFDEVTYEDEKSVTIAATGHSWSDVEWTWSADHSSAYVSRTCTVCGVTERADAEVTVAETPATCTEPGTRTYTAVAELDGKTYTDTYEEETEPALGHDWGKVQWNWSDDHASAVASRTCSACGAVESKEANVTSVTTNPTCTEAGETVYTASAVFDNVTYTDVVTVTIAATGHSWSSVTWTWSDDHSSAVASRTCTACGETEQADAEVTVTETAATCTEPGVRTYTAAAVLDGHTYTDTYEKETEPALGHDWGEVKWTWSSDHSSATASRTCIVCGTTETVEAVVTSQVISEPTEEKDGEIIYTAVAVFDGEEVSDSVTLVMPYTEKEELSEEITYAESINDSDYTDESWNRMQSALVHAKSVLTDVTATQDQVDQALSELAQAVEQLEEKTVPDNYTGFAEKDGSWYYFVNGNIDTTRNDVIYGTVKGVEGWWYVVGGQVQLDYTGVCDYSNDYGWWYVVNGKVDFSKNSVEQNRYGWWFVVGGKVDFSYTGVSNYGNAYGWWYIQNGKVDFSRNSVEQNIYGWWYVIGGRVDFSYTGVCDYSNDYGWWYVVNGKVDFGKNSVEQNIYGWWYVVGGKVDFSYTGVSNYSNAYGWWYIQNGKVDFSRNSVEQNIYGWWYVVGGKVDFSYTGVSNYSNDYGWWYISAGKVDFSFTGRASNSYGTWYCVNGKVDFSRS